MSSWEYSCGAVLYAWTNGEPEYVLVYDSHYGFPKGHMELGETKEQTAIRKSLRKRGSGLNWILRFVRSRSMIFPKNRACGNR